MYETVYTEFETQFASITITLEIKGVIKNIVQFHTGILFLFYHCVSF